MQTAARPNRHKRLNARDTAHASAPAGRVSSYNYALAIDPIIQAVSAQLGLSLDFVNLTVFEEDPQPILVSDGRRFFQIEWYWRWIPEKHRFVAHVRSLARDTSRTLRARLVRLLHDEPIAASWEKVREWPDGSFAVLLPQSFGKRRSFPSAL